MMKRIFFSLALLLGSGTSLTWAGPVEQDFSCVYGNPGWPACALIAHYPNPTDTPFPDDETLQVSLMPKPPLPPLSMEPLSGNSVTLNAETCIFPTVPPKQRASIPQAGMNVVIQPAVWQYACWQQIWNEETILEIVSLPEGGATVTPLPLTGNMVQFFVDMTSSSKTKDYFIARYYFARHVTPHYIMIEIEKSGNY